MNRALDVAEPQVLVHYPAENIAWHHRVLLEKVSQGRWIGLTPDLDLEDVDLGQLDHRILDRLGRFPGDINLRDIYAFDPVDQNDVAGQRRRARIRATILGDGPMADGEPQMLWVIQDPSDRDFGETIKEDITMDPNLFVAIDAHGVARVDGMVKHVQRIPASELDAWKIQRRAGAQDRRTLGLHLDPDGKPFVSFRDAVRMMKEEPQDHWTFDGPRATSELLAAIVEGAGNPVSYHAEWVRLSGVNEASSVCHDHRHLMETIRLGACVDQLDLTNLGSFENIIRRLIQIETAVERCPKHPDFSGLSVVEGGVSTGRGAARMPRFREHVAARQKDRAAILKQERLYREEQDKEYRRRTDGGGGDGGGRGKDKDKGRGRGGRGRGDNKKKNREGADGGAEADQ